MPGIVPPSQKNCRPFRKGYLPGAIISKNPGLELRKAISELSIALPDPFLKVVERSRKQDS